MKAGESFGDIAQSTRQTTAGQSKHGDVPEGTVYREKRYYTIQLWWARPVPESGAGPCPDDSTF